MNDFDFDAMQKKRIARGAYNRVTHSGCSLPSDNLTEAQKRKLNGPVTTFNLNKPMSWRAFLHMDHAHQELYIKHLIRFYHANGAMLAQMFDRNQNTISGYLTKNGLPTTKGVGRKVTEADRGIWQMFCEGKLPIQNSDSGILDTTTTEAAPEMDATTEEITEEKCDKTHESTAEKCGKVNFLLQVNDVPGWDALFETLRSMPLDHAAKVEVKVWA